MFSADQTLPTDEVVEYCSRLLVPQYEPEFCTPDFLEGLFEHSFTFNGLPFQFGDRVDWINCPFPDIEWQILLHKFYYAVGIAHSYACSGDTRWRDLFESLLRSWVEATPVGFIATDVTGRRVQNWTYAWVLFHQYQRTPFDESFERVFYDSLADQVEYIIANLAPARNHRTLELYAIFIAAITFPVLPNASRWLDFAVQEMVHNVETDLLSDGVHCELSSDYHHIALRNYLLFYRVARLNGIELSAGVARRLQKALDFAMHVHRPDGCIPALSDSDSSSYLYLLQWGAALFDRPDFAFVASAGALGDPPGRENRFFESGGYVTLRSAWRDLPFEDARYLVFDCGEIGAGNHGHMDALAIEIAAFGRPLIVDPGRYSYDESGETNWRARFRQTSSHSTVTVNGEDQAIYRRKSENKGAKKKILNPHPATRLIKQDFDARFPYLHGRTASPNYDAVHERHIWFVDELYWVLVDHLIADSVHRYDQRFQLANENQPRLTIGPANTPVVCSNSDIHVINFVAPSEIHVDSGFVSRTYGHKYQAPVITATRYAARTCFVTILLPVSPNLHHHLDSRGGPQLHIETDADLHSWQWSAENRQLSLQSPETQLEVIFDGGSDASA